MTLHAIGVALLSAALTFAVICAIVGVIAFAIGGLLVHVANRELRQRHKPRKDIKK